MRKYFLNLFHLCTLLVSVSYSSDRGLQEQPDTLFLQSKEANRINCPKSEIIQLSTDEGSVVLLITTTELITIEAELGDTDAQFNLGYMYDHGLRVDNNDEEATRWYKAAAKQGHVDAQNNLGRLYRRHFRVEKNLEKAVYWFTQAAEQGHMIAQYNLGYMHCNGLGVEKNLEKAVKWYTQAAEQGQAVAQFNLGMMPWTRRSAKPDRGRKMVYKSS